MQTVCGRDICTRGGDLWILPRWIRLFGRCYRVLPARNLHNRRRGYLQTMRNRLPLPRRNEQAGVHTRKLPEPTVSRLLRRLSCGAVSERGAEGQLRPLPPRLFLHKGLDVSYSLRKRGSLVWGKCDHGDSCSGRILLYTRVGRGE